MTGSGQGQSERKGFPASLIWGAALLFAVVAGLAIYSPVLLHPAFVMDDDDYIVSNPVVHDLSYLGEWADPRYVANATFMFNYMAGGTDAFGYHLVNVLIHAANSVMAGWLALMVFRLAGAGPGGDRAGGWIAFLSGLLFLVHPVETQAVAYITQRYASLAAAFYLLSVVLYLQYGQWRATRETGSGKALYWASVLSALLALKTKETAFTLPVMIGLAEFLLVPRQGNLKARLLRVLPFFAAALLAGLFLLGIFEGVGGGRGMSEITRMMKLKEVSDTPAAIYLMTQFRVVARYLGLLLVPAGQRFFYDFPLSESLAEPAVLLSLALHLSLLGCAWWAWKRAGDRPGHAAQYRLLSFGILWFYVTPAVESSVFPIQDVIFEHRAYLPSAGFFISLSAVVSLIISSRTAASAARVRHAIWCAVAAALCLPLAAATYVRNDVWTDEIVLMSDSLQKTPRLASHYTRRAILYLKRNEFLPAIEDADRTIHTYAMVLDGRIPPGQSDFSLKNAARAYLIKGKALVLMGRPDVGNQYLEHSLRVMSGALPGGEIIRPEDRQH